MRLVVAEITLHEMSNIKETFFHTLPGIAGIKTFKGWSNCVLQNFKRIHRRHSYWVFLQSSSSTRGQSMKLRFQSYCSSNFFFVRVVQLWNKLSENVVSASSVSAFISRLNSMHVSILMFCFSAVCFFINVSFRAAVVSAPWAFLSSRHSSALYCFYCIVSVLMNQIFIHSFIIRSGSTLRTFNRTSCMQLTS